MGATLFVCFQLLTAIVTFPVSWSKDRPFDDVNNCIRRSIKMKKIKMFLLYTCTCWRWGNDVLASRSLQEPAARCPQPAARLFLEKLTRLTSFSPAFTVFIALTAELVPFVYVLHPDHLSEAEEVGTPSRRKAGMFFHYFRSLPSSYLMWASC